MKKQGPPRARPNPKPRPTLPVQTVELEDVLGLLESIVLFTDAGDDRHRAKMATMLPVALLSQMSRSLQAIGVLCVTWKEANDVQGKR